MYFYPPYWPIVSAILYLIILWVTGSLKPGARRSIRSISSVLLFAPFPVAAHALIIVPLVLVLPVILIAGFGELADRINSVHVVLVTVPGLAIATLYLVARKLGLLSGQSEDQTNQE